ncbi:hypothetical protein GH153_01530 [bacterium]|nr:hypothetical protein [bacterium]
MSKSPKDYGGISKEARQIIKSAFPRFKNVSGSRKDHDNWYMLQGRLCGCDALIKHYKVRVIWEIEGKAEGRDLAELFSDARGKRKKFNKQLEEFKKKFADVGLKYINGVFDYLLIEVEKDYKSNDFEDVKEEALTTFFYEVPDHGRKREKTIERIGDLLSGSLFIPKTIIRLGRPSVITSKMSSFLRTELINILYDTCLYTKRKNDCGKITDEMFVTMKQYLGQVLFSAEISFTNAELTKSIHGLSILMGTGAIAGILAVIAFLPLLFGKQNIFLPRTIFGIILLIWAVSILFYIGKKCFTKE